MENVLFKQSLMGFDRRQVLKYIDELSRQMNTRADSYARQQEKLEEEINTLSQKLEEGGERIKLSMENSSRLVREIDGLKQNNAELKRQVTLYRNMITERDREISRIKTDYDRLTRRTSRLEEENREWKAKQDEIAACMVEATVRAKQIIQNAANEARRRKRELRQNAGRLMDKVADMKAEISNLETQLDRSFAKLSDAMRNMDKASSMIENQVRQYRRQVEKTDEFTPKIERRRGEEQSARGKKSLTESVLDTISKLLEK